MNQSFIGAVYYTRRALKIRIIDIITRTVPMPMTTQAHGGVTGGNSGSDVGGDSDTVVVVKLKVALQSLGTGSIAITRQK